MGKANNMRIEIIANRLSTADPATDQHYAAKKGDVLTVTDAFGQLLCDRGWAKDVAGKYANKPFTPGVAKLAPAKVAVKPGKGK